MKTQAFLLVRTLRMKVEKHEKELRLSCEIKIKNSRALLQKFNHWGSTPPQAF